MDAGKGERGQSVTPRVLVVGCGSQFAADDNVGLEIVRCLRERGECGCEFLELAGGGLDLLYAFEEAEIILFVDAVESGAPAGTVHLVPLPSSQLKPRSIGRISGHGWGLDETLRLARSLGRRVPRLVLLGVELETVSPGSSRTPPVDAALSAIVAGFADLLASLADRHTCAPLPPGFTA